MKKLILIFGMLALLLNACKEEEVLTEAEQLEKDIATIDKYLSDKSIVAETDPSGLRYVITTAGTGTSPTLSNKITAKYTGKFLDNGSIFDSGTLNAYPLSGLIQGWQIGFQHIPKGSTAVLYIPSGLAYGKSGQGAIPANSNLIFEVELIDVK